MGGYLIIVDKVKPGDKVRPKERSKALLPESEYTIEDVRLHMYWTHSRHHHSDLFCPGCGELVDGQRLLLKGGQEFFYESFHFDLKETVVSFEALSEIIKA